MACKFYATMVFSPTASTLSSVWMVGFCVNRYVQKKSEKYINKSSMFRFHFFKVNSRSWTFFAAFWRDFVFNQMSQRPKQHLASYSLIPRCCIVVFRLHVIVLTQKKNKITGPHGTKTQDVRANQNHLPFGNKHRTTSSNCSFFSHLQIAGWRSFPPKEWHFFVHCACRRGNKQILSHVVLLVCCNFHSHEKIIQLSLMIPHGLDILGTQRIKLPRNPLPLPFRTRQGRRPLKRERIFLGGREGFLLTSDMKPPLLSKMHHNPRHVLENLVQIDSKWVDGTQVHSQSELKSSMWRRSSTFCWLLQLVKVGIMNHVKHVITCQSPCFTTQRLSKSSSHRNQWQRQQNEFEITKRILVPSRELTYPTWGKGKSSSNCDFGGIC